MIGNSGGLISVVSLDGFLDCASVFTKSFAEMSFSFSYILHIAFGALYTCQLSRIMRESHACGPKTSISRIKDNFSRLTHKSGQVVL